MCLAILKRQVNRGLSGELRQAAEPGSIFKIEIKNDIISAIAGSKV